MNKDELIKRDYQACLNFIDKCDDHLFKIKNWVLFTVSAVIAFSFHKNTSWICLANYPIVISFLYIELVYKSFQDDVILLCKDIDERYEKEINGGDPKEIWSSYIIGMGRHIKRPDFGKIFITLFHKDKLHIIIFYVLLCVFSAGGYFAIENYY